MTTDSVTPSERSLIHFSAPYLEVETQSISALERTILWELAQASHAALRRKRNTRDRPSSIQTRPVKAGFGVLEEEESPCPCSVVGEVPRRKEVHQWRESSSRQTHV